MSESAGEECDDQGVSSTCDIDCTLAACGDDMVNAMAGEECDTAGSSASCDDECTVARCGDGLINPAAGESCDDGNVVAGDGCNADCRTNRICGNACGDGFVNAAAGEQCDTSGESALCDADCTAAWCGDGVFIATAGEECDDGGPSATCTDECLAIACGNDRLDPGEARDPPPGPLNSVPVDDETCRYDFSNIQQFYCSGSCGNWGGGSGCQQAGADVFCKLETGNPDATATSFTLGSTLTAPGVCCPPPTAQPGTFGCVEVGVLTSRGVTLPVSVHDTNLRSTHAAGMAIVGVVCAEP